MLFPLTARDFLGRALQVYADRVAVIDEPDQPRRVLGEMTYAELGSRVRSQAATLDEMGCPSGTSCYRFAEFRSCSFARCSVYPDGDAVPINYRLTTTEIRYIVEHSDAEVRLIDTELKHLSNGGRVCRIGGCLRGKRSETRSTQ